MVENRIYDGRMGVRVRILKLCARIKIQSHITQSVTHHVGYGGHAIKPVKGDDVAIRSPGRVGRSCGQSGCLVHQVPDRNPRYAFVNSGGSDRSGDNTRLLQNGQNFGVEIQLPLVGQDQSTQPRNRLSQAAATARGRR